MSAQLASEYALATSSQRVRRLLVGNGCSLAEAEDLVHEAFLRMHVYCLRGGRVREPEAFLVTTAKRLALNARRDAHGDLYSARPVEELTFIVDEGPLPEEVLIAEQCLQCLISALKSVSHRTRDVFYMHRFEGLTYPEIARRIDVSVSTVERDIAHAMMALATMESDSGFGSVPPSDQMARG